MKLSEIFAQINLIPGYREVCLRFNHAIYGKPRLAREVVLDCLFEHGFDAKYIAKDKVYFIKYVINNFSLEYCFELNGTSCNIILYVKKGEDWLLQHPLSYLLNASGLYQNADEYDLKGRVIYCSTLQEFEAVVVAMKPILHDLLKAVRPHLETGRIEFDIH